jgi:hypothetical protein
LGLLAGLQIHAHRCIGRHTGSIRRAVDPFFDQRTGGQCQQKTAGNKKLQQTMITSSKHHIRSSCIPILPDGGWLGSMFRYFNTILFDYTVFSLMLTTENCFEHMAHLPERLTRKNDIKRLTCGSFDQLFFRCNISHKGAMFGFQVN